MYSRMTLICGIINMASMCACVQYGIRIHSADCKGTFECQTKFKRASRTAGTVERGRGCVCEQEPGAGNVITYPRNLEGIVRKTDTRRRSAREARAERKAAEAAALEAEVKRRKAEKRRELQQRCASAQVLLECVGI